MNEHDAVPARSEQPANVKTPPASTTSPDPYADVVSGDPEKDFYAVGRMWLHGGG